MKVTFYRNNEVPVILKTIDLDASEVSALLNAEQISYREIFDNDHSNLKVVNSVFTIRNENDRELLITVKPANDNVQFI